MPSHEIRTLPIAVRVFPDPASAEAENRSRRFWQEPEGILVIHTVGRPDAPQELLIGSYLIIVAGQRVKKVCSMGARCRKPTFEC